MAAFPQCQHFAVSVSITLRETVETNVVFTQNCLLFEIWTLPQHQPSGEIDTLALRETLATNLDIADISKWSRLELRFNINFMVNMACKETLKHLRHNLPNSSRYGYRCSINVWAIHIHRQWEKLWKLMWLSPTVWNDRDWHYASISTFERKMLKWPSGKLWKKW